MREAPSIANSNTSTEHAGIRTLNNTNHIQYRSITPSSEPGASPAVKQAVRYQAMMPRLVKVSPERFSKLKHFKPAEFTRTSENLPIDKSKTDPRSGTGSATSYFSDESRTINMLFSL